MIIAAAVAEPQLQHDAVDARDQFGGAIEAGALGVEPAQHMVEPAHPWGCSRIRLAQV